MKDGLHIEYYADGSVHLHKWYKDGELHREDAPAYTYFYPGGGGPYQQEWWKDGKANKDDGPAYIVYYEDGSVKIHQWIVGSRTTRVDGPAWVAYYKDGSVEETQWWKDDKQLDSIPKEMLEAYMKANNVTVTDLFTDPDELVRTSAQQIYS